MRALGEFLGTLIILSYGFALLSFILKWNYKYFKNYINDRTWLKKRFPSIMKFFVKNHRYFGLATIVFILMHFTIQFSRYGVSITGALAASLMFLQVVVGIYGHKKSKTGKGWLWVHRTLAIVIGLAILIHIN